MEAFVAFLRDNWKFLVEISIPLVSLIVLCFVRKTKITISESVWSGMTDSLPSWINAAENIYGSGQGSEKLKYVLKTAVEYLTLQLGVDSKLILKQYGDGVIQLVEKILSTPHKKGDQ